MAAAFREVIQCFGQTIVFVGWLGYATREGCHELHCLLTLRCGDTAHRQGLLDGLFDLVAFAFKPDAIIQEIINQIHWCVTVVCAFVMPYCAFESVDDG